MSFEAKLFYLAVGFCIGCWLWRHQHAPLRGANVVDIREAKVS